MYIRSKGLPDFFIASMVKKMRAPTQQFIDLPVNDEGFAPEPLSLEYIVQTKGYTTSVIYMDSALEEALKFEGEESFGSYFNSLCIFLCLLYLWCFFSCF